MIGAIGGPVGSAGCADCAWRTGQADGGAIVKGGVGATHVVGAPGDRV